jgi:hypothetical protein
MHLVKQFLIGGGETKAKDGINTAIGAERRLVTIDPFRNPLEDEFLETVEATTNRRFLQR